MKLLIISDSHMENQYLKEVTTRYRNETNMEVCLGDTSLKADDPLLDPFTLIVHGNHDFDDRFPYTITCNHVLLTHGHHYQVYQSYEPLLKAAKENGCDIVLHGHTHVPTHQIIDGVHMINPGSLMINRGSYAFGTYAILDTDTYEVHFYHHETHEMVDDIVLDEGLRTLEEFKKLTRDYLQKRQKSESD